MLTLSNFKEIKKIVSLFYLPIFLSYKIVFIDKNYIFIHCSASMGHSVMLYLKPIVIVMSLAFIYKQIFFQSNWYLVLEISPFTF